VWFTGGASLFEQENSIIVAQLKQFGFDAVSKRFPSSGTREDRAKLPGMLAVGSNLITQYHTDEIPNAANRWSGGNRGNYSNPELDGLIDRSLEEVNPDQLLRLTIQMEKIVSADLPGIFLYWHSRAWAHVASLKGPKIRTSLKGGSPLRNIHEWEWTQQRLQSRLAPLRHVPEFQGLGRPRRRTLQRRHKPDRADVEVERQRRHFVADDLHHAHDVLVALRAVQRRVECLPQAIDLGVHPPVAVVPRPAVRRRPDLARVEDVEGRFIHARGSDVQVRERVAHLVVPHLDRGEEHRLDVDSNPGPAILDDAHLPIELRAGVGLDGWAKPLARRAHERAAGVLRIARLVHELFGSGRVEWIARDGSLHIVVIREPGRHERLRHQPLVFKQRVVEGLAIDRVH